MRKFSSERHWAWQGKGLLSMVGPAPVLTEVSMPLEREAHPRPPTPPPSESHLPAPGPGARERDCCGVCSRKGEGKTSLSVLPERRTRATGRQFDSHMLAQLLDGGVVQDLGLCVRQAVGCRGGETLVTRCIHCTFVIADALASHP